MILMMVQSTCTIRMRGKDARALESHVDAFRAGRSQIPKDARVP